MSSCWSPRLRVSVGLRPTSHARYQGASNPQHRHYERSLTQITLRFREINGSHGTRTRDPLRDRQVCQEHFRPHLSQARIHIGTLLSEGPKRSGEPLTEAARIDTVARNSSSRALKLHYFQQGLHDRKSLPPFQIHPALYIPTRSAASDRCNTARLTFQRSCEGLVGGKISRSYLFLCAPQLVRSLMKRKRLVAAVWTE